MERWVVGVRRFRERRAGRVDLLMYRDNTWEGIVALIVLKKVTTSS
jgi:hypothetical protein